METSDQERWTRRPWAARAVRVVAAVVPFVAALVTAFLLASWLPAPPTMVAGLLRWVAIAVVATIVLVVVERGTRRLLPLAVLLRLDLAFPDRAPSRLRVAWSAGAAGQQRRRLDEAARGELASSPGDAAGPLLELVALLDRHDRLMSGHARRVQGYSVLVGEQLDLDDDELDRLAFAALLHDVGKLAISPTILGKADELTDAERRIVHTHPAEGERLVEPMADWLGDAARAVGESHERTDGEGYPAGLGGSEIALAARIVAVAAAFDAMTSPRSYRSPIGVAAARDELEAGSGSQFDRRVVQAFLDVPAARVRSVMGPLAWLSQTPLVPQLATARPRSNPALGAVVVAGTTAAALGIIASPTSAISTDQLFFADPVPFVGGTPFTDDDSSTLMDVMAPASMIDDLPGELADAWARAGGAIADDEVLLVNGEGTLRGGNGNPGAPGDGAPIGAVPGDPDEGEPAAPIVPVRDDSPPTTVRPVPPTTAEPAPSTTKPDLTPDTTVKPSVPETTVKPPAATTTSTTTTTTTVPPTTTSTTTTTTTSTTSTTSTTTTSTTVATTAPPTTDPPQDPFESHAFLMGVSFEDSESQPVLPLSTNEPPAVAMPNYDVDRDELPGLLLEMSDEGLESNDPAQVQRFRIPIVETVELDGFLTAELWVAARDFTPATVKVHVGVYQCEDGSARTESGPACEQLADGYRYVEGDENFQRTGFELGWVDRVTLWPGHHLEVRVAALSYGEADMLLGFGTAEYPSYVALLTEL